MATRLRPVWRHVSGAALLAGLLWLMLRWFEHANVYQPTRTLAARAEALGRPFEEARFAARDGTWLHGWFFPAAADSPRRHLAVLHCHGNGGNLSHRLDVAEALLETGVNVLLFDYRGYGLSAGRPSEEGTYLDAEAAHAWLVARGFAASNIIAFGESLGGGVAAELARRVPLAGLVLQSTFTSIPDLGAELFPFLPVRWLARIRYDTLAKLPHLRVPVLVLLVLRVLDQLAQRNLRAGVQMLTQQPQDAGHVQADGVGSLALTLACRCATRWDLPQGYTRYRLQSRTGYSKVPRL